MPLLTIPSGNVASAISGGYEVANSCRFDRASSASMSKTQGAGNRRKATFSCWWKGAYPSGYDEQMFMSSGGDHNCYGAGTSTGTMRINTGTGDYAYSTAYYRDPASWYHMVWAVDTEQGTAADRMKLYINGTQVTSFSHSSYPSEDEDLDMNQTGETFYIARSATTSYGNFMLAEVVWIDGLQLAASSFGEFDEDSPTIWKPKDLSDLESSKGTNGFYLDFEDSSNLGNDVWGGTDFTESNLAATDQASDSPTNNFCTLNPIAFENASGSGRLTEINLRLDGGSSTAHNLSVGTIAVNQGKWWFEAEIDALGGDYPQIGIRSVDVNNELGSYVGEITGGAGYASHGTIAVDGSNVSTGLTSYSAGNIINVGLDLDNNKIYWYINGSLANSGGTTITNRYYTFSVSQYSNTGHWLCNFGASAPYTISSGNADDNNYGNFEHAPPSGYLALCTKNLAEEG